MGAAFHRGASVQNFQTPDAFMHAVRQRFGLITFDLAADSTNHQALSWYDELSDALQQAWPTSGLNWLNPPFANIEPWARRCYEQFLGRGVRTLFLVPASVGSNWFREYVHFKARVFFLSPRLCFDGRNPYPKDCMLAFYGRPPGYECWRWDGAP